MTDDEVEAAATSDADAQPVTGQDLTRFRRVPDVRSIRRRLNMTQQEFAAAFDLSVSVVRDWEQARCLPDRAARALLRVIDRDPEAVRRALHTA